MLQIFTLMCDLTVLVSVNCMSCSCFCIRGELTVKAVVLEISVRSVTDFFGDRTKSTFISREVLFF